MAKWEWKHSNWIVFLSIFLRLVAAEGTEPRFMKEEEEEEEEEESSEEEQEELSPEEQGKHGQSLCFFIWSHTHLHLSSLSGTYDDKIIMLRVMCSTVITW